MLKLENTEVLGWEHAIRGMRNPMNSWEKSDSGWDVIYHSPVDKSKFLLVKDDDEYEYFVGPNDQKLMMNLRSAGTDHRKFMRMITVYVDLTAPLYWWKEFDTYKVGTVANSCSTMHKIAEKEFTLEDFSHEHLIDYDLYACDESECMVLQDAPHIRCGGLQQLNLTINVLNFYRQKYLETKSKPMKNETARQDLMKKYWWQMIQLLPSSYNQRRTVMLNYEVLANIYKGRRNHKLDEWHTFCDWIEGLPYGELITGKVENEELLFKPIEGLAPNTVRELVGMEPISHEVVSDSTPLFLRKSMTIPATAEDIEDSVDISHLVDITCSWDAEELGGERIYAIGPGFTREDLTPYELHLLERTEKYKRRKEKE